MPSRTVSRASSCLILDSDFIRSDFSLWSSTDSHVFGRLHLICVDGPSFCSQNWKPVISWSLPYGDGQVIRQVCHKRLVDVLVDSFLQCLRCCTLGVATIVCATGLDCQSNPSKQNEYWRNTLSNIANKESGREPNSSLFSLILLLKTHFMFTNNRRLPISFAVLEEFKQTMTEIGVNNAVMFFQMQ